MRNEEIDLSEIPEIDPHVFEKMEIRMPKPKEIRHAGHSRQ